MNYVFQRNPRRYSTPLFARNFQGDAKKYLPRVPGNSGGSSRPPDTVSSPAPAPEPRIPTWKGSLKRNQRGTDWGGLLQDVYDGVVSGRAKDHPNIKKFRLGRMLLDDLAAAAIEGIVTGQFGEDVAAVTGMEPGQTFGPWTVVRVCLGGNMYRVIGSTNDMYDPGCLIMQAGVGEGPISTNWRAIALGRMNHSFRDRTDIGMVLKRSTAGYTSFNPMRPLILGEDVPRMHMQEVVAGWLPGLAAPTHKRGYAPPLNRPKVDLDMWPQSKRQGYDLPLVRAPTRFDAMPDIVIEPGGISYQPPRSELPAPPGPRAKERKMTLYSLDNRSTFGRIVGAMGEFGDFVESFYSTLPDWTKEGDRTVQDKLETLYRHWDKVDIGKSIGNLIMNEAEDRFIGELGKLTARANRLKRFGGAGLEWGPAL